MLISVLYILLAILGLSFLIFIHELGHYWMARRVGMRVETFSIGFGRPIAAWERDGVKWQVGWLLFGGYVKIAGSELDKKDVNPYEIPDGFFGKTPLARIKVALMGPIANLVFALLAFTLLWISNGREKNFSEYTSKIGWVDPQSELYAIGVRPGDEITAYDNEPFESSKDHIYAPMRFGDRVPVHGVKVNYATGKRMAFDKEVHTYSHPFMMDKNIKTAGILQPASVILYDRLANGAENPLPVGSPLKDSGIEYGDRIFWVDGELVFSLTQLHHLLSGERALLTIERDGKTLLARVPRVQVQELRPNQDFRIELSDWQFEAGLGNIRFQNLYVIPYNLTNSGVVENPLKFLDRDKQQEVFPQELFSDLDAPLQAGDRVVAINGIRINHSYELLRNLQTYRVNIILQRHSNLKAPISWKDGDTVLDRSIEWNDLQKIVQSIGTEHEITQAGSLILLQPITPKTRNEIDLSSENQAILNNTLETQRKAAENIEDPEKRQQTLALLQKQEKQLWLGLPGVQDVKVKYNPMPTTLFYNVFEEIWKTLGALFSGNLSPKMMAGPVGIIHMVHDTSMNSIKEALYWLGAISLNLGILNLLPIPVLDGGTVLMSLLEMASGKRLHPKTLEKLIIPFAVLLIGLFLFLTYNDLLRLFSSLLA